MVNVSDRFELADKYLSHICYIYYMAFVQHMITSGATYSLLRKEDLIEDYSMNLDQKDSLK